MMKGTKAKKAAPLYPDLEKSVKNDICEKKHHPSEYITAYNYPLLVHTYCPDCRRHYIRPMKSEQKRIFNKFVNKTDHYSLK